MNPWFSKWRDLLLERCHQLVRDYDVDGFYLSELQCYVPDLRGDFVAGLRAFIDELRSLRSDAAIVGEGSADYVPWLTPVFEPRCRSDSAEYQLSIGRFGVQISYSAIADSRNLAGVSYLTHAQYRPAKGVCRNIVPALSVTRATLTESLSDVDNVFRWARQWQALWEGTH